MPVDLPDSDTYGARHVEVALRDLDFPLTALQLRDRAGDWRIPLTGARFVRLGDVLADEDVERVFDSPRDVAKAVRARVRRG